MKNEIILDDKLYMTKALALAGKAAGLLEVPVGAIIVDKDGSIISRGYNRRESARRSTGHAEIFAIEKACKKLGGWRLEGCKIYITLEPCPMCAGAIINSRIKEVIIGARDPKGGAFGGRLNLNDYGFNHKPELRFGVMERECSDLLKDFFKKLRKR